MDRAIEVMTTKSKDKKKKKKDKNLIKRQDRKRM